MELITQGILVSLCKIVDQGIETSSRTLHHQISLQALMIPRRCRSVLQHQGIYQQLITSVKRKIIKGAGPRNVKKLLSKR